MFELCIEFPVEQMCNYLEYLRVNGMLPNNYQLQEYVDEIRRGNLYQNDRYRYLKYGDV